MKNLAGKFFNRSQLDSGRGDYIEPSVANFSDSYNFGENHDGKTGNYRRGLMRKLKIFGVGMMGLIAVACANLNEMDFLSMGLRHRANDPKANLSQSQRNSAWSLGDLFGIAGDREYYKDSASGNSEGIITIPKYKNGDVFFSPNKDKYIRVKENFWMSVNRDGTLDTRKDITGRNFSTDYEITRASINTGLPILREK